MPRIELEATRCSICSSDKLSVWLDQLRDRWSTDSNSYRLVQCSSCGHIYLNPRPTLSSLPLCYPTDYQPYHPHQNPWVAWVKNLGLENEIRACKRHIPPPAKVLEIGSSHGAFLKLLQKHGYQPLGVEFDEKTARFAQKEGLKVHHGTLEETRFSENEFDLVYMKHVIEHLPDVHGTLSEIARILKPGGWLLIATPNVDCPLVRCFGKNTFDLEVPRHLNLFTPKTLKLQLEKAGLEMISTEQDGVPNSWVHSCALKWDRYPLVKRFFKLDNPLALALFTPLSLTLAILKKSSRFRVWARKSLDDNPF